MQCKWNPKRSPSNVRRRHLSMTSNVVYVVSRYFLVAFSCVFLCIKCICGGMMYVYLSSWCSTKSFICIGNIGNVIKIERLIDIVSSFSS